MSRRATVAPSPAERDTLIRLAVFITQERSALLAQWRHEVRELPSARKLDIPTLNDHIPALLDELAAALRSGSDQTIPEALSQGSPPVHGLQRLQEAFDIEEIVAEYNILRGCIHDLADQHELNLQGKPFHTINRVLDHAIGLAVQTYATGQALEVQRRREEYLAFVAHDLRTPLNAISLAECLLREILAEGGSSTESARMLDALRRNVDHLEALVNQVREENSNLQTETGMKLERRKFDLWSLVQSLIYELRPVARAAGTQLINQVPDGLFVYADASLLRRVFQNLIANAIKYTPGGNVSIGARKSDEEGAIECWVSDNGAGIAEALIGKVFDRGETDPQGEGTGLGLAIVKTVVEAHDGRIAVESKEGTGSTFRFSLPGNTSAVAKGP